MPKEKQVGCGGDDWVEDDDQDHREEEIPLLAHHHLLLLSQVLLRVSRASSFSQHPSLHLVDTLYCIFLSAQGVVYALFMRKVSRQTCGRQ